MVEGETPSILEPNGPTRVFRQPLSAWVPLSISNSRTIKFLFCVQRLKEMRVDGQTIGD